jgi:hypothetical protein
MTTRGTGLYDNDTAAGLGSDLRLAVLGLSASSGVTTGVPTTRVTRREGE